MKKEKLKIIINYKSKTNEERVITVTEAVKKLIKSEIAKAG